MYIYLKIGGNPDPFTWRSTEDQKETKKTKPELGKSVGLERDIFRIECISKDLSIQFICLGSFWVSGSSKAPLVVYSHCKTLSCD